MVLFEIFKVKNLIQIYTKMHQIAPFLKNSRGACPRTLLAKRMASPCAARRLATCKFPNLKKKFLDPPPPKSWGHPCNIHSTPNTDCEEDYYFHMVNHNVQIVI